MSSEVERLRAALEVAEAEEAYQEQKAAFRAGDLTDDEYRDAKRSVTLARIRRRVAEGRPGSDRFRVESDGTVVGIKTRTKAMKERDPEDGRITSVHYVEEIVEEVL